MAERRTKLKLCSFESACVPSSGRQGSKINKSFKLCFNVPQRLGVFQVISLQKKFETYFQHAGVYGVLFHALDSSSGLASQEFFPVSHMHLVRCQVSICGLKTTSKSILFCMCKCYLCFQAQA